MGLRSCATITTKLRQSVEVNDAEAFVAAQILIGDLRVSCCSYLWRR